MDFFDTDKQNKQLMKGPGSDKMVNIITLKETQV